MITNVFIILFVTFKFFIFHITNMNHIILPHTASLHRWHFNAW